MKKKLLYRLFGVGKMPADYASAIQNEGVAVSDEGYGGSVTYLNFHSPGRRANWRRVWFIGSIALTRTRLLGFQDSGVIIDVPFSDERFRGLNFSLEDEMILLVGFDASLFHANWSGNIEYRFKTPLAKEFLDQLNQQQTSNKS